MLTEKNVQRLLLATCVGWCVSATNVKETAAPQETTVEASQGFVEFLFEDRMQDWALSAAEGAGQGTARLEATGQILMDASGIIRGQLNAPGDALQLVSIQGEIVPLQDPQFTFTAAGTIDVRTATLADAFTVDNLHTSATADGGLIIVGDMALGSLSGAMKMEAPRGTRVATLILGVDATSIREVPKRQQLLKPQAVPPSVAAGAGTPDVIVWDVGVSFSNSNDIVYHGTANGIAAYAFSTQSCNKGTAELDWYDSGGDTRHPVIAQNMFRYKDGRLEQVGQSWLKHGFCAVSETEAGCSPCIATGCDTLGLGCADTYTSGLNDGRNGGSKRFVNPTDGSHTEGSPAPTGNNTIRGRLQVHVEDIDPAMNAGAEYFIESQYITADDAQAGSSINNASWRRVVVQAVNNVDGGGATQREQPAIYAWANQDASVEIKPVLNTSEGVSGIKTYFYLGFRVTSLGNNKWRYEYAIQNLNSQQSAGGFSVDVPSSSLVSEEYFHDVDWHSGDPYDGTDWPSSRTATDVSWSTDDFATNANANAIRWGTLYNFGFTATTPPTRGNVRIGVFEPGGAPELNVSNVLVPSEGSGRPFGGITGPGGATVQGRR